MKVYNYSDTPVNINGVDISDTVLILDNEIRMPFITHNGNTFTSNQNNANRNEVYTIINGTSPNTYKYYTDSIAVPNVWSVLTAFFTVFTFLFIVKIIQKIKTR